MVIFYKNVPVEQCFKFLFCRTFLSPCHTLVRRCHSWTPLTHTLTHTRTCIYHIVGEHNMFAISSGVILSLRSSYPTVIKRVVKKIRYFLSESFHNHCALQYHFLISNNSPDPIVNQHCCILRISCTSGLEKSATT